jgi:hypothetical protein
VCARARERVCIYTCIYIYYEGTYYIGDVLNCITDKSEVNYATIEKYDYNIIVNERHPFFTS